MVPHSDKLKKKQKGTYKRALMTSALEDRWGPEQSKVFATLKALLTLVPVSVDNNQPLIIGTDTSAKGLAAYLA